MMINVDELRFDERGLVPAVVQDARTREVLTLAYMNAESLNKTVETKETWFWSRSRSQLWHKGETSGHTQRVVEVLVDCDRDALVVLVEPAGPACHTGARSCFNNLLESAGEGGVGQLELETKDLGVVLRELYQLIESRRLERPEGSYTTYLFDAGLDKILKKVGEEASETIIAAKNDDRLALTNEAADLLYHLLVLMVERGLSLSDVGDELLQRKGKGR
jgi:phosphoribosyl-ATP pyrophosphohydrolase/phosphoribosyl-AMP cyclohydrolase